MFSRKRHWISWTRSRPDPTRPDLDLGAQFSYPIPRSDPLRPDPILESGDAPCWALFISDHLEWNLIFVKLLRSNRYVCSTPFTVISKTKRACLVTASVIMSIILMG